MNYWSSDLFFILAYLEFLSHFFLPSSGSVLQEDKLKWMNLSFLTLLCYFIEEQKMQPITEYYTETYKYAETFDCIKKGLHNFLKNLK